MDRREFVEVAVAAAGGATLTAGLLRPVQIPEAEAGGFLVPPEFAADIVRRMDLRFEARDLEPNQMQVGDHVLIESPPFAAGTWSVASVGESFDPARCETRVEVVLNGPVKKAGREPAIVIGPAGSPQQAPQS